MSTMQKPRKSPIQRLKHDQVVPVLGFRAFAATPFDAIEFMGGVRLIPAPLIFIVSWTRREKCVQCDNGW